MTSIAVISVIIVKMTVTVVIIIVVNVDGVIVVITFVAMIDSIAVVAITVSCSLAECSFSFFLIMNITYCLTLLVPGRGNISVHAFAREI